MSLVVLPASLMPRAFRLELQSNQRVFGGPFGTPADQAVDLMADHWECSFELPARRMTEGGVREAFIASMRNMTNWVALHHFARPVPRGTLRGTPTIKTAADQGAGVIVLQAAAGVTLQPGDMLGCGGLLLMCADVCIADGTGQISVPLVNRLRRALSAGSAVQWNKPTALFRMLKPTGVQYVPGAINPTTLDFFERLN